MLHQPRELEIPSMAAARNQRMGRKPMAMDCQNRAAADESVQLVDAIDEAFATLTHKSDEKTVAEFLQQTDSLAGLLAIQLQELDQQRSRLSSLLEQIGQPASTGK